jgi:hypothetical protein
MLATSDRCPRTGVLVAGLVPSFGSRRSVKDEAMVTIACVQLEVALQVTLGRPGALRQFNSDLTGVLNEAVTEIRALGRRTCRRRGR